MRTIINSSGVGSEVCRSNCDDLRLDDRLTGSVVYSMKTASTPLCSNSGGFVAKNKNRKVCRERTESAVASSLRL